MKQRTKNLLDKKLTRERGLRFFSIICIFLIISIFGYLEVGKYSVKSSTTIGVIVNHTTHQYYDGSTILLWIKVPNEDRLIRVALPQTEPFHNGASVELIKSEKLIFTSNSYRFIKYASQ